MRPNDTYVLFRTFFSQVNNERVFFTAGDPHKAVFVFVGDVNAHHSEWLDSVPPTYRQGRDALDFCNLSGSDELVRCPTHIAGNRLDLAMTDVPDIVDVFVGTPLGTSDHGFVSCVLRVEQSIP